MEYIRESHAETALKALSIFPADADREAVGYVADLAAPNEEDNLEEGLVTLERLSVVQRTGSRFGPAPLVRGYIWQDLSSDAAALETHKRRYVTWYALKLVEWRQQPYQAIQQFIAEQANVVQAFEWCLATERNIQDLLTLLEPFEWFMFYTGNWTALVGYLEKTLSRLNDLGQLAAQCDSWGHLGGIHHLRQEYLDATDCYLRGLTIARAFGDRKNIAHLASSLAESYAQQETAEDNVGLIQEALDAARNMNDPKVLASVLRRAARVYLKYHEYNLAEQYLEQAIRLQQEVADDPEGVASAQWWLGVVAFRKNELPRARAYLEASHRILSPHPSGNLNLAAIKKWLALLEEKEGHFERAATLAKEAMELFKQLNMRADMAELTGLMERLNNQRIISTSQPEH